MSSPFRVVTRTATICGALLLLAGCGKLQQPEQVLKVEPPAAESAAPPETAIPKQAPPTPQQIVARFVELPRTQKTDEELLAVADLTAQLPGITELDLGSSAITDTGAALLPRFTALQRLELSGSRVSAKALEIAASLPTLESLRFNAIPIEDAHLGALTSAHNLTELSLAGTSIGEGAFERLAALENLRVLEITGNDQVLGRSFTELVKQQLFRNLTTLSADSSGFGHSGLLEIGSLPNLEHLSVSRSLVTDEALAGLKTSKSLKRLYLNDNMITDAGLPSLKRLTQLEELRIGSNPAISDAGLKELRGLRQLKELRLDGTRCTLDAARELKQRFLKSTKVYCGGQEL